MLRSRLQDTGQMSGKNIYREDIYREDIYRNDIYRNDIFGNDIFGNDIYRNDIYKKYIYKRHIVSICVCICACLCMVLFAAGCGSDKKAAGAEDGKAGSVGSAKEQHSDSDKEGSSSDKSVVSGKNSASDKSGRTGGNSGSAKEQSSASGEDKDVSDLFDARSGELLLNTDVLNDKSDNAGSGSDGSGSSDVISGSIKEIVQVKRGDYKHELGAIGEIYYQDKYYETVKLNEARFKEFKVEKGDKVKKGDAILTYKVELDEADIEQREAEVLQSEKDYTAGYDSRQAEINKAEHELEALSDKNEIQIKKLEIKKLKLALKEYTETKKHIEESKSELNKYKSGVKSTKMTASHDGYVMYLAEYNKDDMLVEGTVAAIISPKKDYLVQVEDASENKLRFNSEVTVNVDKSEKGEAKSMKGIVVAANNILTSDNAKEYSYVKVLDEPEGVDWNSAIKISYTSKELKDVLTIPRTALNYESVGEGRDVVEQAYVYLYENDHAFKRYIEVYDEGGDECVVIQGLTEGQQLAVYE